MVTPEISGSQPGADDLLIAAQGIERVLPTVDEIFDAREAEMRAELEEASNWNGAVPGAEVTSRSASQSQPETAFMPVEENRPNVLSALNDRAAARRVLRQERERRAPKHVRLSLIRELWTEGLSPQPS